MLNRISANEHDSKKRQHKSGKVQERFCEATEFAYERGKVKQPAHHALDRISNETHTVTNIYLTQKYIK